MSGLNNDTKAHALRKLKRIRSLEAAAETGILLAAFTRTRMHAQRTRVATSQGPKTKERSLNCALRLGLLPLQQISRGLDVELGLSPVVEAAMTSTDACRSQV
jgi:hypothetical protein